MNTMTRAKRRAAVAAAQQNHELKVLEFKIFGALAELDPARRVELLEKWVD